MRHLFLVLFAIISFSSFSQNLTLDDITQKGLDQSFLDNIDENELMILDFTAKWCGPCKRNEENVFQDQTFINFIYDQSIHFVKIDIDNNLSFLSKQAIQEFGVTQLPTYYILTKKQFFRMINKDYFYLKKHSQLNDTKQFIDEVKNSLERQNNKSL